MEDNTDAFLNSLSGNQLDIGQLDIGQLDIGQLDIGQLDIGQLDIDRLTSFDVPGIANPANGPDIKLDISNDYNDPWDPDDPGNPDDISDYMPDIPNDPDDISEHALTIQSVLVGVPDEWRNVMDLDLLEGVLEKIRPDMHVLAPDPPMIFEAFRYFLPLHTKIVILGQDPYPTPGHAMGLAFSTFGQVPMSLANVYSALIESKLMRQNECASGDLRSWAGQGILMINKALTTIHNTSNAHAIHWGKFTDALLESLCEMWQANGRRVIFLLWGRSAQEAEPTAVKYGHIVFKRPHPSPNSDNRLLTGDRFKYCTHFTDANRILKEMNDVPIVWDPLAQTIAFTDGSCIANGTDKADASFAVFIAKGPVGGTIIVGRVEPYRYKFKDASNPAAGFVADYDSAALRPSNNRGEYLAWCWCLYTMLRAHCIGASVVYSDCKLFISTIKEWLPKRRAAGAASYKKELENFDLIQIADTYYQMLKDVSGREVLMVHTNSAHGRAKPEDKKELAIWLGNDKVDRLAKSHLVMRQAPWAAGASLDYNITFQTYSPIVGTLI